MKMIINKLLLSSLLILGIACSSNPHKAEKIDTNMNNKGKVSGDSSVGVKDGNLVFQKKVNMAEELRRLQYEVYGLEDKVYGSRKFGSQGMYGSLKACRLKLSSPELGGDGKLMWTEPIDRVTDKEDEFKIGIDENEKIAGVSEEFLKDRIKRFVGYKKVLQKREDEYREKVEICEAEVRAKEYKAKKAQQESN